MNRLFSFFISILLLISFSSVFADNPKQINLLIHPFLKASEIEKRFLPLVQHLSRQLKLPVGIKISDSYDSHINSIGQDQYDFAYIGPYAYVKMVDQYGLKPLLGRLEVRGRPTFRGKIVTLIDSNIRTIDDLKGKRFAFGDPDSTMSYLVPRYLLEKQGISLNKLASHLHYSSHSAVISAIFSKIADAGAVKEEVYYKNMDKLKAIARTPAISEHLFLSSPHLPSAVNAKLKEALLTLNHSRGGLVAMRSIKSLMTGVVPVKHEDYNNLQQIHAYLEAR